MVRPVMDRIAAMLEDRGDVWISHQDPTQIIGCQLRRLWHKRTVNPEGFNPVEKEHWEYYGQMFVIRERRRTTKGNLIKSLAELQSGMGRLGGWLILVTRDDPFAAVIDRLNPVPSIGEYLQRVQK